MLININEVILTQNFDKFNSKNEHLTKMNTKMLKWEFKGDLVSYSTSSTKSGKRFGKVLKIQF